MGLLVIAAYRPRPGKEAQLLELVKEHLPILRKEGLATDRPAQVVRAKDGTILEIFEWKSQQAIDDAHDNEAVLEMWNRFNEACSYEIPSNIEEFTKPFPHFEPIDL